MMWVLNILFHQNTIFYKPHPGVFKTVNTKNIVKKNYGLILADRNIAEKVGI